MRMNDEEVLSACLCTAARLLHSVLHVFGCAYDCVYCTVLYVFDSIIPRSDNVTRGDKRCTSRLAARAHPMCAMEAMP